MMYDWQADLKNHALPKNDDAFGKIKCDLRNGIRIGWFDQDDVDYAHECDETIDDLRADPPFSGLVIAVDGMHGGDIEPDECIVVMDRHPTEKCDCVIGWIAMNRLIDSNVLEIVSVETKRRTNP